MAQERTFTLIGNFTDNISPSLKKITKSLREMEDLLTNLSKLSGKGGKNVLAEGFKSAQEEVKVLGKTIENVAKKGFDFDRSGIKAAIEDVKVLDREIEGVSRKGFEFDHSSIKSAQKEATVLGDILKANALIQVGQGVSAAGGAGLSAVGRGVSTVARFIVARFQEAAADQLQDIQARGSLFGSLNKEGMFANAKDVKDAEKLKEINDDNYDITKSISRSLEGAIAEVVKSSTVSTETITVLSRQLSDNLLPSLLKAKQITDLSQFSGPEGRAKLEKIMGGKTGVGTKLATLYEQIGSIIPSPSYAPMAAAGFTQFLGTGKIDKSLSIFQSNPVLVSALEAGIKKYGNTIENRIKALTEGLQVAMPEAALMEARTTIAGGFQSISDSLTNATAGILSMGADVSNQGQKTLAMAKKSGAYQLEIDTYKKREAERLKDWLAKGARSEEEIANYKARQAKDFKSFSKGLTRMYESADSPIEVIAVTFGPLMQNFADLIGSAQNLFIGPVVAIMEELQKPLTQLRENLKNLASDVRAGKPLAEAVGEAIGNFFKAIATLFKPDGLAEKGGDAIQKVFDDFRKGFEGVDGAKYMKIVMDGLTKLILKAIFNEGNVIKGLTPLGDGLIKIFALLAAPAFISALISGLVPVAIWSMGKMTQAVFSKLTERALQWFSRPRPVSKVTVTDITPPPGVEGLLPPAGGTSASRALATTAKTVAPEVSLLGRVGGFFSKSLKVLGKFGGVILAVTTALEVLLNLMSGKDIYQSLAAAAPALLGTLLGAAFGSVGAILGGLIGQWLSGFKPVTDTFEGIFRGLGAVFSAVGATLGPIFSTMGSIIMNVIGLVWNVITVIGSFIGNLLMSSEFLGGLVRAVSEATGKIDLMQAVMIAIKVVLAPIVILFQLLEQALNAFNLLITAANVKLMEFRLFLHKLFNAGRGDSALEKEIANLKQKQVGIENGIIAAKERHMQYYSTPPSKPASKNTTAAAVAPTPQTYAAVAQAPVTSQVVVPPVLQQGIPTIAARAATQIAATNSLGATARASNSSLSNIKTSSAPVPNKLDSLKSALMVISTKMDSVTKLAATLNSMKSALTAISSKIDGVQKTMTSGGMKVKFMIGSGPGGGPGSVDAFNPIAASHGLQITSSYRPGDPGYHGINRARDYSNGTGPTPQMLKFATFMAATFGGSLAELIYTPLGFSIKDGRVVPPYAQAGHYNHVHVAYGMGAGMPAFFSSAAQARAWEAKVAPTNASIATVTSNSSEGFGGNFTLNAPVTIYQQPHQDPEELAAMVAMRISMAVDEMRNRG